ncbi:hypothetical protein [Polaromonas sp. C04]|uniref:hypothetical protein n=1 Tax=Polaromonas sp. C04 TaxID=1945857 RepID=UPI0009CA992B|nr:hypothetical protein [Polaromonas sp. C04]OOG54743.1 hypothetical protein B0E49_08390 [Polaromonas sp. C04]
MKKASTKMADQDIQELKRDQLGAGVHGKYLKHFMQSSNVVVLKPEIQKVFPTSEAVNKATRPWPACWPLRRKRGV